MNRIAKLERTNITFVPKISKMLSSTEGTGLSTEFSNKQH